MKAIRHEFRNINTSVFSKKIVNKTGRGLSNHLWLIWLFDSGRGGSSHIINHLIWKKKKWYIHRGYTVASFHDFGDYY